MKIAWTVLLITAFTDFIIASGTGLTTAMVESRTVGLPSANAIILSIVGGLVVAARTVQQALKTELAELLRAVPAKAVIVPMLFLALTGCATLPADPSK